MGVRARYRPLAAASNNLVASTFLSLIATLLYFKNLSLASVALGCAVVLIANLLFLVSGAVFSGLVPDGRLKFPTVAILPIVFSALGFVVASLAWRVGNPLEPTIPAFRIMADLYRWPWFLCFPIGQFLGLMIGAFLQRDHDADERVEST